MSRLVRGLDALAVGLTLLAAGVVATGGGVVGGVLLTRPEDLVLAGVAVVALRALLRPIRLPAWTPGRVALAATGAYAAVFSFIALTRHLAFETHALDLGYYVQVVWSIAHGRGAWVSLPEMNAWGDHFSPVLYLFVPLALVVPPAILLLVGQTLGLAGGGLAVFGFARQRLGQARVAAGFALLYLLNPSLHGINLRDVHPQAFAIPLVLAAACAFERGRYGWAALALVLTAGGREDAAVAVVGFGAWLGFGRRKWTPGAVVAAAGLGLLLLDVHVVMPYFKGQPYRYLYRYAALGGSIEQILLAPILRPGVVLRTVLTAAKTKYVLALLAPLGFLPLLAPGALVGALPGLAMNLLSQDARLFHYRSQYQSFLLPFLVLAAVEGYARLAAAMGERRWLGRFSPGAALAVAALAAVALTSRTVNELLVTRWWPGERVRAAYRLLARVPPMASVSANERFVPHLATRPLVFRTKEDGRAGAEWVLDDERFVGRTDDLQVVARDGGYLLARTSAAARPRDR